MGLLTCVTSRNRLQFQPQPSLAHLQSCPWAVGGLDRDRGALSRDPFHDRIVLHGKPTGIRQTNGSRPVAPSRGRCQVAVRRADGIPEQRRCYGFPAGFAPRPRRRCATYTYKGHQAHLLVLRTIGSHAPTYTAHSLTQHARAAMLPPTATLLPLPLARAAPARLFFPAVSSRARGRVVRVGRHGAPEREAALSWRGAADESVNKEKHLVEHTKDRMSGTSSGELFLVPSDYLTWAQDTSGHNQLEYLDRV